MDQKMNQDQFYSKPK